MRKRLAISFLLAFAFTVLSAKVGPVPQFNPDKTFKIIQFTDLHLRTSLPDEVKTVYARLDYMVESEKPDFIVITGDVVTVKPAAPEWKRLIERLDSYGVPWCIQFGNHDIEQDLTYAGMAGLITAGRNSCNTLSPAGGLADVEVPIISADGRKPAFYIFCMDSHSDTDLDGMNCYDWFTVEQVQWMRDRCSERKPVTGKPEPALAFFHIPLREYLDAWSMENNPRQRTKPDNRTYGFRGENICCSELNTGMFSAMKLGGSVIGCSVGHDHNNDFIAAYNGMALCYGRFTGANTVTNNLPGGARIFLLTEGDRGFETWIREDDGRIVLHALFDGENVYRVPRDRKYPYGTWFEAHPEKLKK